MTTRRSNPRRKTLALLALAISLALGCASSRANLLRRGEVSVQTEAPRHITLSVSGVYQVENQVEVSGRVWRHRSSPSGLYTGHIDAEIVHPDGKVTSFHDVASRLSNIRKGLGRRAFFVAKIEGRLDQGSKLRLEFHRGRRHPHET